MEDAKGIIWKIEEVLKDLREVECDFLTIA